MRMWMLPPAMMCRKHLLGEHGEIHKFRHNFVKKHKMGKRVELGQIEPAKMKSRHDELVDEMLKRGYNHNSPYEMPDVSYLGEDILSMKVNKHDALKDLEQRCPDCAKRIEDERQKVLKLLSMLGEEYGF